MIFSEDFRDHRPFNKLFTPSSEPSSSVEEALPQLFQTRRLDDANSDQTLSMLPPILSSEVILPLSHESNGLNGFKHVSVVTPEKYEVELTRNTQNSFIVRTYKVATRQNIIFEQLKHTAQPCTHIHRHT